MIINKLKAWVNFLIYTSIIMCILTGCGSGHSNSSNSTTNGVSNQVIRVTINQTNATILTKNLQFKYSATATYVNGTTESITTGVSWVSSNSNIATINESGLVTANSTPGQTNITATYQGITSAPINLTITNATLKSLNITPSMITLTQGSQSTFTALAVYSDNSTSVVNAGINWNSSNQNVATINNNGVATVVAASGSTNITATYQGVSAVPALLTVTSATVQALSITPNSTTIQQNAQQQYVATVSYSDHTTAEVSTGVSWISSNPKVAIINNSGMATVVAASGSTNITATYQGVTTTAPAVLTASRTPVVNKPYIMAYYPNYYGYFNNNSISSEPNSPGHVIAEPSYVIPGILEGYPAFEGGSMLETQDTTNDDLMGKLSGVDALVYSFAKIDPSGSIQLSDPWADLGVSTTDNRATQLFNLPLGSKIEQLNGVPAQNNNVKYNGFGAFINLSTNHPLDKILAIGGWAGTNWKNNLTSSEQINTFIQSIQELYSVYTINGLDFDIENNPEVFSDANDFASYINNRLPVILSLLNKTLPNLKISLTIQANPALINSIGSMLQHNQTYLNQINLMTYDFHGTADFNGNSGSGTTGFNSNLYVQDGDPFASTSKFSVDLAVNALNQYVPNSMITIGIPTYGRAAISGIENTNNGLFQTYNSATSMLLPGDLDATNCSNTWSNLSCSGTFEYRYIVDKMLTNGFKATNWQQNGVYNATTAYASSWTVQPGVSINGIIPVGVAEYYPSFSSSDKQQLTFSNVYIAYISGIVAKSYGNYAAQQGLKGAIVWDIMGDTPYSDTINSLIYNFRFGMAQSVGAMSHKSENVLIIKK